MNKTELYRPYRFTFQWVIFFHYFDMTGIDPNDPVFDMDVQYSEVGLSITVRLKPGYAHSGHTHPSHAHPGNAQPEPHLALSAYSSYHSHDSNKSPFLIIQAGSAGGPLKIWPIPPGYDTKNPNIISKTKGPNPEYCLIVNLHKL